MKVSVAIATFNGGRYLRAQLDSICRQSLQPLEVVICDDGSSDDTVEVAREFAAQAPFAVIIDAHAQRLGFTQNFVRAIGHCTGEIVALCDQDDIWHDGKLAAAAAEFVDEEVSTVTHRVQVTDEHLNLTPLIMPEVNYQGTYSLFTIDPWFSPNGMQLLFRRARISPWLIGVPPLSAYGFGTAPFDEWIFYLGTLTGTAVMMRDVLGLWRRHGLAITRDVKSLKEEGGTAHKLRLALHSGAEAYAYRAEVTDSRAELTTLVIAASGKSTVITVEGAAEFYREMSRMFRRRMTLHGLQTSHAGRLRAFLNMLKYRDYRTRDRGGSGFRAMLKDGFTIFFGPRTAVHSL